MRIESVRSLKAELCARLNVEACGVGAGVGAISPKVHHNAGVALGAVRGSDRMDWRLAIRLQRRTKQSLEFAARAKTMASGEVEAQFVGTVYGPRAFASGTPELTTRTRPLRPGLSIAHFAGTAGTLGAFAYDASNELVIVSNAHVLSTPRGAHGDCIFQPGPADGGGDNATVARLKSVSHRRVHGANHVDAATAVVASGIQWSNEYGFGAIRGIDSDPNPGSQVWKIGRTTGFTRGTIRAVELDGVEVWYDDRLVVYDNQIEIAGRDRAFSDGGDSGSLILNGNNEAVALLFAGTPAGNGPAGVTYANPITAVTQELGIRLI